MGPPLRANKAYVQLYKASGIRLEQLKSCVDEMVENEILSPGDSDTVSLVFFVTKKQNKDKTAVSGRLVFDYSRLNEKIKGMNFPLMPIKNFFDQASQYSCFAAIDIRNAFLTVSMTERAKKRCDIITPFGVFIPQRMPFSLKTSPAGFCFEWPCLCSVLYG